MTAWSVAVILNTAASFQAFLASYPNSDLGQTARKLQERVRNRVPFGPVADAGAAGSGPAGGNGAPSQGAGAPAPGVQNAALNAPMCPCIVPPVTPLKRADTPAPAKKVDTPPTKKAETPAPRTPVVQRQPTTTAQPARGYDPNEAAAAGVIMGIGAGMLMRGGRGYGGRGGYEHGD